MPTGRDATDRLCEAWAITRRELLGFHGPLTAAGYIGAMRCTLGARRDLHAGARSPGRITQHFPEVFVGDALAVNLAVKRMPEKLREIMDIHYCIQQPRAKAARAELMGLSARLYWDRVRRAKLYVEAYLAARSDIAA